MTAANDANCIDSIDCTLDACDQLGGPGTGCSFTPNHGACDDEIGCTDDSCDQLGAPGTGCSNTPNVVFCDDLILCTDDACDQLAGPGAGCSNVADDANCTDSTDCTVDACDQLAAPGSGCSYTPNHSFCDDLVTCTTDACDQLAAPGTGCSNVADDANCDNDLFCDGLETCDAIQGCLDGPVPCTVGCAHCVEETDSCEWCVLDLDGSGFVGTGDFALFSPCFGECYPPGNPCLASDFDDDGCVGTADYAAFVDCFGYSCGECAGCAGPGRRRSGRTAASGARPPSPMSASIQVVAVRTATPHDIAARAPRSVRSFAVGEEVLFELWAVRANLASDDPRGLASAYVDLTYDSEVLAIVDTASSSHFGVLSEQLDDSTRGVLRRVGGCAALGERALGTNGLWVRVATVVARAKSPGRSTLAAIPSNQLHGIAVIGHSGNIDSSQINFGTADVIVHRKGRSLRKER